MTQEDYLEDGLEGYSEDLRNCNKAVDFLTNGRAYFRTGNYNKAIECFENAIKLKPDFAEAYELMGYTYSFRGDYDTAIGFYKMAIKYKPDFQAAYYDMGGTYLKQGNYGMAINCYETAIKHKPDDFEAYYNMGNAYQQIGDYEAAKRCLKKAEQLKILNNMGLDEEYKWLIEDDKFFNKGRVWFNNGNDRFGKGDYLRAIYCYNKVIEISSDSTKPHYGNLNNCNYDEAVKCYKKAIELTPDFVES